MIGEAARFPLAREPVRNETEAMREGSRGRVNGTPTGGGVVGNDLRGGSLQPVRHDRFERGGNAFASPACLLFRRVLCRSAGP